MSFFELAGPNRGIPLAPIGSCPTLCYPGTRASEIGMLSVRIWAEDSGLCTAGVVDEN